MINKAVTTRKRITTAVFLLVVIFGLYWLIANKPKADDVVQNAVVVGSLYDVDGNPFVGSIFFGKNVVETGVGGDYFFSGLPYGYYAVSFISENGYNYMRYNDEITQLSINDPYLEYSINDLVLVEKGEGKDASTIPPISPPPPAANTPPTVKLINPSKPSTVAYKKGLRATLIAEATDPDGIKNGIVEFWNGNKKLCDAKHNSSDKPNQYSCKIKSLKGSSDTYIIQVK